MEDEGEVTELTTCTLFPDHHEPAVGKRYTEQDCPINPLVGQSP